jgi:hypothetical protein
VDIPAPLFAVWEQQHVAAERSRMLAKEATERRLRAAEARVKAALQVLEQAARMEYSR